MPREGTIEDSKEHSLLRETGTDGVKGAALKEVVALEEPDGATFRRTPHTTGAEGPVVKNGAPIAEPVIEASMKEPTTKESVEAIPKNGIALKERKRETAKEETTVGDCKKKGGNTKKPVDEDFYSLEALLSIEVSNSRTAVVRAPSMHSVQASPKKNKKQPGKVDDVAIE
jgi:hypothetical protein